MSAELPIDIHCDKIIEWLEARNKLVKGEWPKELNALQAKKKNAIALLPQELKTFVQGSAVDYFSAQKIIKLLEKAQNEQGKTGKNLFGSYTDQTLKTWDELVNKTYIKNNIFLAESARILTQNITYEIPALKKTLENSRKQLTDLSKKIEESNKRSIEFRAKFLSAVSQLGVSTEGCENEENLRANILATTKELKSFFRELVKKTHVQKITDSIQFYQEFCDFTLSQAHLPSFPPLLKTLRSVTEAKAEQAVGLLEQDALRQEFVTDLSELLAFLTSRLSEFQQAFKQSDTMASSVLAQAPPLVQSHQSSTVDAYLSAVNAVLECVKTTRFQKLLMINKSKRYVDRLVNSTIQHQQTATRLSEVAANSEQRITEMKETVAESRKTLETYVRLTLELKAQVEIAIGKEFNRNVHLFGDIPQI